MRASKRALTLIAALAITAGACGTSGKKDSSTTQKQDETTTSTTTTPSSSTAPSSSQPTTSGQRTTTPPSSADEARVKQANIVAGDLPSGWTSSPHAQGPSQLFATCAPEINLEQETKAQGSSAEFDRKTATADTQVNSVARILSSESTARAVMAKFRDPVFVACVDKNIKEQGIKAGTGKGKLSTVSLSGYGDEAAGIDGQISGVDVTTNKQARFGVSIVAIRTGDLVTVITGASLGPTQSGDGALFQKLAQAVSDRQQS